MRSVRKIYRASSQHWVGDGFLVQPLFSHMGEDRDTDPFLMLDYAAPYHFAPNETQSSRGVGQHPHKGFETVTITYHGEVAHRDSSGGGGIIKAGDVQWMTAGAGIIHEEFHAESFSKSGGLFEMVQLWVNLPAKYKNTPAHYQYLAKEDITVVDLPNDVGYLRLIAGDYADNKGAAQTYTPMNVWDVVVYAGKKAILNIPQTHNLSIVVLRGPATFNGKEVVNAGELVCFNQEAGEIIIQADEAEVKLLLLSGEPINEPVVGYGPFVMNTQEEIRQAMREFRLGRFGHIG